MKFSNPPFFHYQEIPSTMLKASEIISEVDTTLPFVVQADRQIKGRGRQNRQWLTYPGNLFMTLYWPRPVEPRYSLVVGVAMHEVVAHLLPNQLVQLKWPNDILVSEKKVGGCLIERESITGNTLIGMSVNIKECPEDSEVRFSAGALAQWNCNLPDATEVAKLVCDACSKWLGIYETHGFKHIQESWIKDAYGLGKTISMTDVDGQRIEGTFESLDFYGQLVLRLANGHTKNVMVGDVIGEVR
jgi:BirA family biotin operon repressor/biotin-[acetyl-CoA-carboxylase] ligase